MPWRLSLLCAKGSVVATTVSAAPPEVAMMVPIGTSGLVDMAAAV